MRKSLLLHATGRITAMSSLDDLWRAMAEEMAFHLVGVHCDVVAITRPLEDNIAEHWREHFGVGGIRNHDWNTFTHDSHVMEAILEEVEGVEDT